MKDIQAYGRLIQEGNDACLWSSIIRLPEAESAPSPSVQAESTSGESGQISFLHELGIWFFVNW